MSKVQVDKVVNLSDDGAPQLTYGAELPVGYGLTGAGGLNISGVVTAASAVFSGNVTIGGTLTYEDVTNIDVVGVSTFAGRMNVNSTIEANEGLNVTGISTLTGDVYIKNTFPRLYLLDTDSNSDFSVINSNGAFMIYDDSNSTSRFTINSSGVGAFNSDLEVAGSQYITDSIIHTGDTNTKIRFPSADTFTVETAGSERVRVSSAGSFAIGDATEPGARLYVNGVSTNDIITARAADSNGASVINILSEGTTGISRIKFSDTAGTDGLISYNHSNRHFAFSSGGTSPQAYLDSSGRLLIGTAANQHNGGDLLQLAATSSTASVSLNRYTANAHPSYLNFFKSRDASLSGQTVVQDDDTLGMLAFYGSDGTDRALGAEVCAQVDGTPGSDDMPSRLVFRTSADGSQSPTERLRITAAGLVGINNTSPATVLDIKSTQNSDGLTVTKGSNVSVFLGHNGSGDEGLLFLKDGGTTNIQIYAESGQTSYFNSGSVLFGTTSGVGSGVSGAEFHSSNAAELRCGISGTGNSTQIRFYNGNGEVGSIKTNGSATTYNTSSDYRLKENASAITNAITRLKTLKPYRFNFKADSSTVVDGFFAHEVTAVPEAISGTKDQVTTSSDVSAGIATTTGIPIYQAIDQSKLVPLLTAALQEAVEETESLKTLIKNSSSFAALKSSL